MKYILAVATLVATLGSAQAATVENGISVNGISVNGISVNGISVNGIDAVDSRVNPALTALAAAPLAQ